MTNDNDCNEISGRVIICQFRKHSRIRVIRGSSNHRAMSCTLDHAYCVVDKAYTRKQD